VRERESETILKTRKRVTVENAEYAKNIIIAGEA